MNIELIHEMIDYIEKAEERLDWECGQCRNAEELIEVDGMPEIWHKLNELIK